MAIRPEVGGFPYLAETLRRAGVIRNVVALFTTPVKDPPEWRIRWMKPEPLHTIENTETVQSARTLPWRPATLRVEFKSSKVTVGRAGLGGERRLAL